MNNNVSDLSDEILLIRSFTRLLYNSYMIFNENKEEQINYYENANEIFKEIIEDNKDYIKYYNRCCFVLLGNDENFCGRFSIKYLKKSHNIFETNYDEIVNCLSEKDELLNFFCFIFEPVIVNLYDEYIQDLKNENKRKIYGYIISNAGKKNEKDCSICMESIGLEKTVKFDCNHMFHYDCIFKWFMEKQCCPVCRKEF